MEEKMKELKEKLLGKEFDLLDLDNEVQCILKNTSRSLFDDVDLARENESWTYFYTGKLINVMFKEIKDAEDEFHVNVKVTEIEEL